MDDTVLKFRQFIGHHRLFAPDQQLLLAVSGGLDSVVLASLCNLCGFKFSIAHVNFQLRGVESLRDELFVRDLAEHYKVNFFFTRFETSSYAALHKTGIQESARTLRYAWFAEILNGNINAEVQRNIQRPGILVTAHQQDDNIETMLMHLFRGTGISGLRGMLPRQDGLVRPMLNLSRQEIADYAASRNIQWVEDSSNSKNDYTRNLFRNTLLPMVETVFPAARLNLAGNLSRFRETESLFKDAVLKKLNKIVRKNGREFSVPVNWLKQEVAGETLLYEWLKQYGFSTGEAGEAMGLLHSETGRYIENADYRLLRNRDWLLLSPRTTADASVRVVDANLSTLELPHGTLRFLSTKLSDGTANDAPNQAWLDAAAIRFPLIVRRWKNGDYFYPLGMEKKKKLARFLIDKKLSRSAKESVWVVENDQRILWVIGHRIDNRFRVTDKTKHLLHLSFEPAHGA